MEINNCRTENALKGLVSLRSSCITGNCTPYYIEDLEGVDLAFLSKIAGIDNVSGEQYANQVIDTAARIMLGDLGMNLTSGYSLVEAFGETCSTCSYINTFVPGGGAIIRNLVGSKFSILKVSKVEINCNATGSQMLVFDDGKTVQKFPFTAMGMNVVTPVVLKYETVENLVKVFIEDQSIPVSFVTCATTSGCGCSGSKAPSNETSIKYSGLMMGVATVQQYAFKICASVVCSSDLLTATMVNELPNMFGLTLLYKVGSLIYSNAPLQTRNNRAALDSETQQTMQTYYESLYQQRLVGTKNVKGLKLVYSDYIAANADRCVRNQSVYRTVYAAG